MAAVWVSTSSPKFSVDWGQMIAAGVLALIPACIFFAFIQRYLVPDRRRAQGLSWRASTGRAQRVAFAPLD